MNIGDAAAQSGLPAKTIRYYEDIGLISPDRSSNGYRDFSEDHLHKLSFVQRARSLGFTVEECRALLSLYEDRGRASADVKTMARSHLTQIGEKITALQAMQATLSELVDKCHGDDRPDCPILDGLAGNKTEESI
ncbi:MAG: Cu(I)-responsive transcriptional regulator [Rhodobacteraceae bacterium]|nr:Cu(I)-responsive transcriptional regulator [Paracoccaceae bacterium]